MVEEFISLVVQSVAYRYSGLSNIPLPGRFVDFVLGYRMSDYRVLLSWVSDDLLSNMTGCPTIVGVGLVGLGQLGLELLSICLNSSRSTPLLTLSGHHRSHASPFQAFMITLARNALVPAPSDLQLLPSGIAFELPKSLKVDSSPASSNRQLKTYLFSKL